MALKPLIAAAYLMATTLVADRAPSSQALDAVEADLRRVSQAPDLVRIRRAEVFQQSLPDTLAVCGQVSRTGADGAFADFAAVVTMREPEGAQVQELHVADGPSGAARTRAEIWLRCTDEARRLDPGSGTEPPSQPRTSRGNPAPVMGGVPAAPGGLTVTMRQGGNLRSGPDAGSPVIRTLPRGTVAHVFGEPQRGWYQIGDTQPWGWVHISMLEGPPR